MNNNRCRICGSLSAPVFVMRLMNKYNVQYFHCTSCGFLQTEKPFWLEEAYQNPINLSDTGIILRNQRLARIVTSLLFIVFDRKGKFLDYAGGFGLFTRMMRDIGFDFYWHDPFTKNEMARGFDHVVGNRYSTVTSFESFEHFEDPVAELGKIMDLCDSLIISTEPLPEPLPAPNDWWYYGTEHGQHISLFSKKSLRVLASKLNAHCYSMDNVHIFTRKPLGWARSWLVQMPYVKYVFYALSFLLSPFMKSKTISDMTTFKRLL